MTSSVEEIAQDLFDQHRQSRPFQPLPQLQRQGSLTEAYRIQERLQEHFITAGSGPIAGYKVALTSATMQAFVGVDEPLAGAIFENYVYQTPVSLDLRDYQHLGVECEIAVRLSRDLQGRAGGHTAESVASAIGAVMPAFELIEDRNADYDAIDAFSLVADNAWNAGIVLGPPTENWRGIDLLSVGAALSVNGHSVGEGKGADALGNPLAAVAWLADLMAERGRILKRGMVVMTGSIVTTYFPKPGDLMSYSLNGVGDAIIKLEMY
jgi:2-keto-4-pentenoate hydratase